MTFWKSTSKGAPQNVTSGALSWWRSPAAQQRTCRRPPWWCPGWLTADWGLTRLPQTWLEHPKIIPNLWSLAGKIIQLLLYVCEMVSFWSCFSYGNHGPLKKRICRSWNAGFSRAMWNYQRVTTIPGWKVPDEWRFSAKIIKLNGGLCKLFLMEATGDSGMGLPWWIETHHFFREFTGLFLEVSKLLMYW